MAGGEERVDPSASDIRRVQRKPADACVGIGGYEDIAPGSARADRLRQVTANRKRDAINRGEVVPERRNGIQNGSHALTLAMRCPIAQCLRAGAISDRSPDEVFASLTDPTRLHEWQGSGRTQSAGFQVVPCGRAPGEMVVVWVEASEQRGVGCLPARNPYFPPMRDCDSGVAS